MFYLRLLIRLLFVRTPVLRHAYLQTVRPVRYSLLLSENNKGLAKS